jgi:four helix bundle protein
MTVLNYSELIAWQKAMDLVCEVYQFSSVFPAEERFGLTSQIRRAAVSIPANIAEGQGRATTKDFLHFLSIAYGSLREVETFVVLSCRLGFTEQHRRESLLEAAKEVGRLINGLSNSLRRES